MPEKYTVRSSDFVAIQAPPTPPAKVRPVSTLRVRKAITTARRGAGLPAQGVFGGSFFRRGSSGVRSSTGHTGIGKVARAVAKITSPPIGAGGGRLGGTHFSSLSYKVGMSHPFRNLLK